MKELSFAFETNLEFVEPVEEHAFLLRCVPLQKEEQQLLSFMLNISPFSGKVACGTDGFGNRTYSGYVPEPHGFFSYQVTGRVRRDDERRVSEEPLNCYRYNSPLTQPNRALTDFLSSLDLSGSLLEKAAQLSQAVHTYFAYEPGSTDITTSAEEAFSLGQGVCQDYTHVFVTLARLLGLPARYVSGLPLGDGASHAWAEVWHEGLWYGFDPTRNQTVDEGYIKLCVGRDYQDCPIERGIFKGLTEQKQTSFMKVTELF